MCLPTQVCGGGSPVRGLGTPALAQVPPDTGCSPAPCLSALIPAMPATEGHGEGQGENRAHAFQALQTRSGLRHISGPPAFGIVLLLLLLFIIFCGCSPPQGRPRTGPCLSSVLQQVPSTSRDGHSSTSCPAAQSSAGYCTGCRRCPSRRALTTQRAATQGLSPPECAGPPGQGREAVR